LISCEENGQTKSLAHETFPLTLLDFYNETVEGLEAKIQETVIREQDIYDVFQQVDGKSLNSLKKY